MPIDDPRVRWDERRSPFVSVAQIWIPSQDFRLPARRNFAEALSFTPAHSVPAHAAVGSINSVRQAVYDELARRRYEINAVVRGEPTRDDCWVDELRVV
jgi:hypothetical protein